MVDEWSGFAALLANLIEKYAAVLDLDALPDLVIEEAVPEKDESNKNIHENDICLLYTSSTAPICDFPSPPLPLITIMRCPLLLGIRQ